MINFNKKRIRILGQMSGTSCDGNDFALIEINLDSTIYDFQIIKTASYPFSEKLELQLNDLIESTETSLKNLQEINLTYTLETISKMKTFLRNETCDLIGFHGQTVFHKAPNQDDLGSSLQLGILPFIAKKMNIPLIADFRNHDMAFHGQGAPLVPFFDYKLFNDPSINQFIVNIGGISNASFLAKNASIEELSAGDIGPGNILIDLAMKELFNKNYDHNGETASKGRINYKLIESWLNKDYFQKKDFPKSTGREYYNRKFLENLLNDCKAENLNNYDMIAILSQFTVESILTAATKLDVKQIQISGGGAKNTFMMNQLKMESQFDIQIMPSEMIDFKEAIIFALLAYNYIKSIPSSLPNTTGIRIEAVLGSFIPA